MPQAKINKKQKYLYEYIQRYNKYCQQESDGTTETDGSGKNDSGASGQVRGERKEVQESKRFGRDISPQSKQAKGQLGQLDY